VVREAPPLSVEPARAAIARRAIDEAARWIREGDPDAARDRLDRLRAGGVPAELSPVVDGIAALLEAGEWKARLEGSCVLEPVAAVVEAGEPARLRLRLRNDGDCAIALLPSTRAGPAAIAALELSFVERRADGTDLRERATRAFPLEALELPAGGEVSVIEDLPTSEEAPFALREYAVAVELRPSRFAAGGKELPLARVRLAPCAFRLCPRGYRAVAERPLESLRRALRSGPGRFDRHVLLAAAFVPEPERAEAVAACRLALAGPEPARRRSAAAALRILLGRDDLPPDPDLWSARLESVASLPAPR
jgi:hypothetical protein